MRYTFATAGGKPVRPETAITADGVDPEPDWGALSGGLAVLFECGGEILRKVVRERMAGHFVRCDHHFPGDPGYGKPPQAFWMGSSLGQLVTCLQEAGILPQMYRPTREQLYAAAADHCLAAAYRGECPGIDPDQLMRWRAESRAAFQNRSVDAILADIESAREAIAEAPRIIIGGEPVADLRGHSVPELPEAAAREGIAVLATPPVRQGERAKVVLQAASPEVLRAWPRWAATHGILDTYGDPLRGFAGGYISDEGQ